MTIFPVGGRMYGRTSMLIACVVSLSGVAVAQTVERSALVGTWWTSEVLRSGARRDNLLDLHEDSTWSARVLIDGVAKSGWPIPGIELQSPAKGRWSITGGDSLRLVDSTGQPFMRGDRSKAPAGPWNVTVLANHKVVLGHYKEANDPPDALVECYSKFTRIDPSKPLPSGSALTLTVKPEDLVGTWERDWEKAGNPGGFGVVSKVTLYSDSTWAAPTSGKVVKHGQWKLSPAEPPGDFIDIVTQESDGSSTFLGKVALEDGRMRIVQGCGEGGIFKRVKP